ncbi:hypothetical protein Nepgr_010767 [Nepenthes gracilis]|uniref:Uncharacterized protein n=1 Tax=Nepenthes gracilis TaxID=150966 RepID=A0AAD3SE22_NEPGR|nr:hypothetical protein Nepgr_010767 [Nepenthes gracilis]
MAAIYLKQLWLFDAAGTMLPDGETMNYVIVDSCRISEFPFGVNQTWTTSLQLCITLSYRFPSSGTHNNCILCSDSSDCSLQHSLAKLQYMFQSKLMSAQDERLKVISEALRNMKVLKLHAWETHFMNVIEN